MVLDPTAVNLAVNRLFWPSFQWQSHSCYLPEVGLKSVIVMGGAERIRTSDLGFRKPALCPLSYSPMLAYSLEHANSSIAPVYRTPA